MSLIRAIRCPELMLRVGRYVLWATGEPGTFSKCVALDSRNGFWKTAECVRWKAVLCKISLRIISPPLLNRGYYFPYLI